MLIVCNGAPKSGSTWVSKLVENIPGVMPIPATYRRADWVNPSLAMQFIQSPEDIPSFPGSICFTKTHIVGDKNTDGFLRLTNVKFVNIIRDYRDTFVSRFHHDKRTGNVDKNCTLQEYFKYGRAESMINLSVRYQRNWHLRDSSEPHPFLLSYELLHSDWNDSVRRLLEFLALPVKSDDKLLDRLREATRVSDRQKGPGKFYRSANVGCYAKELDDDQISFILESLEKAGYLSVKRAMADKYPYLSDALGLTDIGL